MGAHEHRDTLAGHTMKKSYPSVEQAEIFAHYRRCMVETVASPFESSCGIAEYIAARFVASGLRASIRYSFFAAKERS